MKPHDAGRLRRTRVSRQRGRRPVLTPSVPLQCPGADEAYFIAKEILATERTYLKDLEVITVVSILRPF